MKTENTNEENNADNGYPLLCDVCGQELRDNQVQMDKYHVPCAEKIINVFCVQLEGNGKYIDRDLKSVLSSIENDLDCMEDSDKYIITREKMTELQYRNLPEFDGF